ncbi:MAG: YggT family protein [Gemmatimonadales bacterium]|nr:YggT family protein [Gemmatimonadales bacterium]
MALAPVAGLIDLAIRAIALSAVGLAAIVAATHWAVRSRRIAPLGAWSKTVRSLSDPVLRPLERQLARRGGNPQDASLWLIGIAVVLGLALVWVARGLIQLVYSLLALRDASPLMLARVGVDWAITLIIAALFVRFIGTWFGLGSTHRGMRPFYALTEWILAPIRRRLPPFGIIDASPIVAYLLLLLLRALLFRVLGG